MYENPFDLNHGRHIFRLTLKLGKTQSNIVRLPLNFPNGMYYSLALRYLSDSYVIFKYDVKTG